MTVDAAVKSSILDARSIVLVVLAGVIGELVLELIAWGLAPVLLGRPMQPAMLVAGLAQSLFGFGMPMPAAFILHLVAGVVVFPLGYLLFRALTGLDSPAIARIIWGVVLWLFAAAALIVLGSVPVVHLFLRHLALRGRSSWPGDHSCQQHRAPAGELTPTDA